MKARLLLFVGGIMSGRSGLAGPLSAEPTVGIISEYASNPYLRPADGASESDVALVVNSPLNYDLDANHFSLLPSARLSNNGTYGSLNSNYLHVIATGQFSSDLGSLSLTAGFGRDSSLYQYGLSVDGVGVRSDSTSVGLSWLRSITERLQWEFDVNGSQARYNDVGSTVLGLSSYRYFSAAPSLSVAVDELTKVKVLGSAGHYKALDGITSSKDINLQLGVDRTLDSLWKLSASAGYSKSTNEESVYFGPFLLGHLGSDQKGAVFNVSLARQGEVSAISVNASRAFRPSGFAYLSRQDVAETQYSHTFSERWSATANASFHRTGYPGLDGATLNVQFFSSEVSATWHWTPVWLFTARTNWVSQDYEGPSNHAHSVGASLELSRQFYRIEF